MKNYLKLFLPQKQRGAVLAFSLVMLLLLTLVGMSMIKQNKVQITVATNAGQQVKAFATVESALSYAQAALELLRYQDKPTHHCKNGTTQAVHPVPHSSGTLTGLPNGITAEVQDVYCVWGFNGTTGTERRCIYSGSGVRNMSVGTPEPTTDNVLACLNLSNAGTTSARCNMEVYNLHVTMDDTTTGAKRTVESKFQIDCSGDIPPL